MADVMRKDHPGLVDPPDLHAALIFSLSSLRTLPVGWWGHRCDELCAALRVVTGYKFGNQRLRVQNIFGEEFSVHLTTPGEYHHGSEFAKELRKLFGKDPVKGEVHQLSAWNHQGHTAIYRSPYFIAKRGEPIPGEVLDALQEKMEEWTRGKCWCSDCGASVTRGQEAGRYFAGLYCEPCWSGEKGTYRGRGGWKKVEAEETYD